VLKGETYLPPLYKAKISENPKLFSLLTKRETEVLALIRQNRSNHQIAESLRISVKTVKNHISNIYFKTGTANREDLLKL
jgi:DNA-binding NarL/FixJ family response regulator